MIRSPDGSALVEIVVAVVVLLAWFAALFWALPVFVEALR